MGSCSWGCEVFRYFYYIYDVGKGWEWAGTTGSVALRIRFRRR